MRLLDDRPGSAARNWLISGSVWFAVGTSIGLIAAIEMSVPDLISWRYFLFSRIRPCHTYAVWAGFVSMTLLGAGLHYLPRLCATTLSSEKLGNLAMWLWNGATVAALVTLTLGYTQAHEYAEPIPPIAITVLVAMLILTYVTFATMARRREPLLYVSTWYYGAALIWTALLYGLLGGIGWHVGIYDAVWTWFFGHNIFGLWLTPLAIGASYYTIPRAVKAPLFSHTLSLLAFWTLVAFYSHAGVHHLLQAPVPAWQKVVAILDSMLLLIAVYAFLANIWLTMRGKLWRVEQSIALKYVFAGTLWYFVVSTQGSLQSLIAVQRYEHFTNWVVGHAHVGILGFSGFIAVGVLYDILPAVTGAPAVYSARLANFQYWLMLFGLGAFAIILTSAGLIQGSAWLNGETVYRVVPEMHVYMVTRAFSGTFIVTAAYLQLWNVIQTVRRRPPEREPQELGVAITDEPVSAEKEE